jgi:hypothetical protein
MAAALQSPAAIRESLVRLGRLSFDDFLLLSPQTSDSGGKWGLSRESSSSEGLSPFSPELTPDWSLALNNAPHIQRHFRSQIADCRFPEQPVANRQPSIEDIHAAQQRLVAHFAYDLLRAKAPPLYDALPWHDWDFSVVTRRFQLWRTRFLLAGDGTTVAMCRCRKSAGVYVLEPDETMARYIERKAVLEKVRRFRLVSPRPQAPSLKPLSEIPLPGHAVDLAIIGSVPSLDTGDWKLVTREMLRISRHALLVENNPLCPPLAESTLTDAGFRPDSVEVTGLGARRCWWRTYLKSHL